MAFDEATEAWLCALTAFEVARRLVGDGDSKRDDISAKVEVNIEKFGLSLRKNVERVEIACCDQAGLQAYYLPAGNHDSRAPAVICIGYEQERGVTLLGRLLPVVVGRDMSALVVCHDDVARRPDVKPGMLLSCCLDYLVTRSDVDAARIGVYGEGLSATLATDFTAFDSRVAAAVCDGGLWNWARMLASVGWMANVADENDEGVASRLRSRLVRQLKCPVLVVAGGRGFVSMSEAVKLQADCSAEHVDIDLAVPSIVRVAAEEIENFVSSDECIFGWLEQKLSQSDAHGAVQRNAGWPACRDDGEQYPSTIFDDE
ncbi:MULTISPECIES: alpha/beta hydrolase family protein [unclassified Bradyrhizobium]|uniref:alpha/beta hydrolase family protein n=1 Tax=unclassified Bradyrhizobium TaxID=2631580 RepID=UPI00209F9C7A|nr:MULTISPECIES: alpha/beta hydrolase [unclassified Bradyrhizobium]MCP1838423.1 dienelactone hydrolase [Bradyrhizobium sp. USDA 4538]MCP1898987.1 dienelactone hydrolase [Bradyrhizobium sp. USDA 4537]MCP1986899.1 dienelactone hydrolase [Bradyrhizobium sp. USDA 4539]